MVGKKRTRNGDIKLQQAGPNADTDISTTEPCKEAAATTSKSNKKPQIQQFPQASKNPCTHQKLPRLPKTTTITKRPLLHPALPTPFASSASPKVIYITASSPFIPAVKRIRKLLSQITKREKQSAASRTKRRAPLEANGRLRNMDVERNIVEGVSGGGGDGEGKMEKVYLKATGRAIPRALELGVHFQGEDDCVVRVEMGSLKAIDDLEVTEPDGALEGEDDVPETRIRIVSSVTVSVWINSAKSSFR